jgi:ABC-2 type transport system permease protein
MQGAEATADPVRRAAVPTAPLLKAGAPTVRRFGRINIIGLISLIRREFVRQGKWLGMAVLGPAIQSVLFASVFALAAGGTIRIDGIDFLAFLGAGLVMSAVMQRAMETTGFSIMFDKLEADGLQDLLSAPMSPMEILAGYLATAVGMGLLVGAAIWIVMALFGLGLPVHPLAALGFLIAAAAIFSLAGLVMAVFSAKWDGFAGKETFAVLPLIFLSGTFFPLSAVPEGAWQTAFQANPIYYLVDGFRWAATGRIESDPLTGGAVALGLFAVLFAICARLLATGYRLKP